jgi:UDP-N-acetylmuramate dehydrogenase
MSNFPSLFIEKIGRPLRQFVSLQKYSNFRIGGEADYFFEAQSSQELKKSILLAHEQSVPYFVIGGGNNLLFDDKGFFGLIIKNGVQGIKLCQGHGEIEAFAGTDLMKLVQFCLEEELSGFEFLAGIPGTVGGAIYSNAGAFSQSIGEFLKKALIFDEGGEEIEVEKDYFKFGYRQSILKKGKNILLKAVFGLQKGTKDQIKSRVDENLEKRKKRHPSDDVAYAGSFFKNPLMPDGKRVPAALLLEKIGAKSLEIGDASVYPDHANFIINLGQASAQNILHLARELKKRVKQEFGIELEEEVIFLPASSR